MSSTAASFAAGVRPGERVEVLFEELAELAGQRNAIDGRVVQIVAELDRDERCGVTGAPSVAWKLGASSTNAHTIATVAHRLEEFPRCVAGLREGRLSLDQVGVIAGRAAAGSDEHYAVLAASASVSQLRTAVKLEPRPEPRPDPDSAPDPDPDPAPEPDRRSGPARSLSTTSDEDSTTWRITLPHAEAAKVDAALQSHRDALVAAWKRDHVEGARVSGQAPPL